jgi:hypothetical protein
VGHPTDFADPAVRALRDALEEHARGCSPLVAGKRFAIPEVGAYSQGHGIYPTAREQDCPEFFSPRSSRCFGAVQSVDHHQRALVDDDRRDLVDHLDQGVHVLFIER